MLASVDTREDLSVVGDLDDAHACINLFAFEPVRNAASIPPFVDLSERSAHAFGQPQSTGQEHGRLTLRGQQVVAAIGIAHHRGKQLVTPVRWRNCHEMTPDCHRYLVDGSADELR